MISSNYFKLQSCLGQKTSIIVESFLGQFALAILVESSVKNLAYKNHESFYQRWSRGHKARGQGQGQGHKKISRPRPRTDSLEAKAKDQGHRRKCSRKKQGF